MTNATWRRGNAVRTGKWEYVWCNNTFYVYLDKPVAYGEGTSRRLSLLGYETPEWGGWIMDRGEASK